MFTTLVAAHATGLVSLAVALVGSKAEAEDIVQDVFLRIWASRESWTPQGSIGAYLATAVRRRAIDILRHRRVAQRAARDIAENLHEQPTSRIPDDALWQAVAQLDPRWREAIVLRYLQKLSYADISRVLEVSPDAARMTVNRAVQALRKVLERE